MLSKNNNKITPESKTADRADSVMDSHTTGPGFKTRLVWYFLPSFRLTTTITSS